MENITTEFTTDEFTDLASANAEIQKLREENSRKDTLIEELQRELPHHAAIKDLTPDQLHRVKAKFAETARMGLGGFDLTRCAEMVRRQDADDAARAEAELKRAQPSEGAAIAKGKRAK